jgi:hypothetical protein
VQTANTIITNPLLKTKLISIRMLKTSKE